MSRRYGRTRARLNFREGPGREFRVLSVLEKNAPVTVLEDMGEWLNIRAGGSVGYVHVDFIDLEEVQPYRAAAGRENGRQQEKPLGVITAYLNMRNGPGLDFPINRTLDDGETVEILESFGEWLNVQIGHDSGYVLEKFVDRDPVEEMQPLPPENAYRQPYIQPAVYSVPNGVIPQPDLAPIPPPPAPEPEPAAEAAAPATLRVDPESPVLARRVAYAWNEFRDVLSEVSPALGLEPAVAAAVLAVEGGSRGFGPDGRLLIRFEVHVFWHYWGRHHKERFDRHFQFNPQVPWKGHLFRPDEGPGSWKSVHNRIQDREWQAYHVAEGFSRTAARLASGMGLAQIMGFHFGEMQYPTVDDMFRDFSCSEAAQVRAFFEFLRGQIGPFKRLEALQSKDFKAFAGLYNGPSNAEKYGRLIREAVDLLDQLSRN